MVNDARKLLKLVSKINFNTSVILNENLVAVYMDKISVKLDKPSYIGSAILDISKTVMYDFHYAKMVPYFGKPNIGISYCDSDAFCYYIKTEDMYEDLRTCPFKGI